jgi:hypothetical protein
VNDQAAPHNPTAGTHHKINDDEWDDSDDDYDEAEAHDRWHRWYHAGCADCDLRADRIEAGRP